MYFRLNPECYFIKGKRQGAIFDLINCKIYALNPEETKILTLCEKNNSIPQTIDFLDDLKKLCLGNYYPKKTYIQKLRVGSPIESDEHLKPPELFRAFLEINNECDKYCDFCGLNGIKRSSGCMGCNVWNENDDPITLEKWKEVIDELKYLNCQEIFISGGDLTLQWAKTIEILDYANGKFMNIYVTLHQQNISKNIINDLENKANLIIQTEDINILKSNEFIYLLTVKPENWDFNHVDNGNIILDFVVEDKNLTKQPHYKKEFPPVNLYQFINNIEYHPCLGHTLTICYNGNVIPCPMMRHSILGNLCNNALHTIFREKLAEIDKFWKLNLDKIENCTGCEFRYICTDCRALEENITGRLNGKSMCSYNPEIGEWL